MKNSSKSGVGICPPHHVVYEPADGITKKAESRGHCRRCDHVTEPHKNYFEPKKRQSKNNPKRQITDIF